MASTGRRRRSTAPKPPKPMTIMAQVAGSGTAPVTDTLSIAGPQQQLSRVGEGANEVDGAEHERDHPERCVRGPALLR